MARNLDPDNARSLALVLAVVGFIFGSLAGYHAISGELSGHSVALKPAYRSFKTVPVAKANSPKEFRQANNFLWGIFVMGFGVGSLGVYFYRGLGD